MKRSLLVLINLLSYASPSFATLDDQLVETNDWWSKVKELRPKGTDPRTQDPRYEGRSAVYGSKYPKMVMIHPYNHGIMRNPFSAALSHARGPQFLEDYHAQHLPEYKKVYSFVVQPIQYHQSNAALKPHYFVHPDAPTNYAGKDYHTSLRWTVVPGAQGQVEPLGGSLQTVGLLTNDVYTHHRGDGTMGVSADVMHLKGLDQASYHLNGIVRSHIPSKDLYSLVAFEDEQGKKIAAITYHWLLSPSLVNNQRDLTIVKQAVDHTGTLREFIADLEKHVVIGKLTDELKRYVDYSPKEEPLPAPQQPIVEKPIPQKQNEPVPAPQKPVMTHPASQKQVSPSPNQKTALQKQTTPVKTNAKAAPARKVAIAPVRSVVQKPSVQSKAPAPIAKASPVKTNAKVAPARKVAIAQARKANATPVPSVVQKPVAKTPAPTPKVTPLKTNTKRTPKAAIPVKKVLTPATKKATLIVKKILASKVATRKAPVHKATPRRTNTKTSPKEALVHKGTTKTAPAHKTVLRKTPVRKASPVRTKAIRAKPKR